MIASTRILWFMSIAAALISPAAFADRTIYFAHGVDYCHIPSGYLRAVITVYNPSSQPVVVQFKGALTYTTGTLSNGACLSPSTVTDQVGGSASGVEQTIPANGSHAFSHWSTALGCGCYQIGRFHGSLTVKPDPSRPNDNAGFVTASGTFLTQLNSSNGVIVAHPVSFTINGGQPF